MGGADINFDLLYGDGARLDAPHITWKHQRYWTAARPSSSGSVGMPGHKVSLPDGSVAFSTLAELVPSTEALMESAVVALDAAATLVATEERAPLPPTGEVTTLAHKNLGGITLSVYASLATPCPSSLKASQHPLLLHPPQLLTNQPEWYRHA